MGTIGILTCEILELEFANLLVTDPDISQITVLENPRSARLIETLESRGVPQVRRIPHIKSFFRESSERLEVLVHVFELGLHRRKKILQQSLTRAAREMSPHVDALFLGYGLCGGAFENPKALFDVEIPVFIPMDGDHPVDDCVGLLLGGREQYYAEQRKIPGTFFMTPGWTTHWNTFLDRISNKKEWEAAKRMFARYSRALIILIPGVPLDGMKQSGEEFQKQFGLCIHERIGTLEVLANAWKYAKASLVSKTD